MSPEVIIQWPDDWMIEDVVTWTLEADSTLLAKLKEILSVDFSSLEDLANTLKLSSNKGGLTTNYLLLFRKQRVRRSELKDTELPGERLLLVENESCQHQLPDVPETIAVLGAGFDLGWTEGRWLRAKQIGYWGDIDTWGLQFLANARQTLPHLHALMMTPEIYDRNIETAVPEPVIAGTEVPAGLDEVEQSLYRRLLKELRGRLEQEFLPEKTVRGAIQDWRMAAQPYTERS